MRYAILVLLLSIPLGLAMMFVDPTAHAAEKPERVLRHIVLYKFKDGIKPAELQEVIDTFNALPKKINTIIGYEAGTNVSPEGKSDGLTHVFVVTFKDEKGRDEYLVHPAHKAYVEVVKDRRDKVVVFDYWGEK